MTNKNRLISLAIGFVLLATANKARKTLHKKTKKKSFTENYPLSARVFLDEEKQAWVLEIQGTINGNPVKSTHRQSEWLSPESVIHLPELYEQIPSQ